MTQYRHYGGGNWLRNGASEDHVSIGVRGGSRLFNHYHRRSKNPRPFSIAIGFCFFTLSIILLFSTFFLLLLQSKGGDINRDQAHNGGMDTGSNATMNGTRTRKFEELKFGLGSVTHGQDSHYWDKDDRRRDEDNNEESGQELNKVEDKIQKNTDTKSASDKSHRVLDNQGNEQSADTGQGNHIETIDADEYDDGIDLQDNHMEDYGDVGHEQKDHAGTSKPHSIQSGESSHVPHGRNKKPVLQSNPGRQSATKKKLKRRKFSGTCEMKILNSSALLIEPLESRKFARFSLMFTEREEKPLGDDTWEPRFAGHQTLGEREESFIAHDQKINCGFVKGPKGTTNTGFDLAEDDAKYISTCHIAVISCIFGNSDRLRSPLGKKVSRSSRKNICFVMFVDEDTLQTLKSEGQMPDMMGFVGLWKIVVVKNPPYTDMRRFGKIPKFLPHRLFPSARYSIWLDSKLRLQLDPMLILEYFLWRKGYEYAISNHYDRHCLWEEVAQNKRLNKYNHSIIDEQFAFYQADGMRRFNASDPNKLLPSNVPEGSFIVRAHTPMSNLFSCLWFNEVDRFTPRDQLSFAYTYHKLRRKNPEKPFHLNMFKDCERRKIAKLYHHRSEERRAIPQQ